MIRYLVHVFKVCLPQYCCIPSVCHTSYTIIYNMYDTLYHIIPVYQRVQVVRFYVRTIIFLERGNHGSNDRSIWKRSINSTNRLLVSQGAIQGVRHRLPYEFSLSQYSLMLQMCWLTPQSVQFRYDTAVFLLFAIRQSAARALSFDSIISFPRNKRKPRANVVSINPLTLAACSRSCNGIYFFGLLWPPKSQKRCY